MSNETKPQNGQQLCIRCGKELGEDDYREYNGGIVCEECYEDYFFTCDLCGEIAPQDEMELWGDSRICQECMEERCPSFDQSENGAETEEAYKEMLKKYVGKATSFDEGEHALDYDDSTVVYKAYVTVDEDGRITDISRLTAEMITAESERWSEWRPYPIYDDDYQGIIEDMLEVWLDDSL